MAELDKWTVVASVIPNKPVSTAEILRMVADGWHLTPGTAAYQTCVDQLRQRADEEDAKTVEGADPDPSAPVSIPLPPEPPRDRVVEAVDQDGLCAGRWEHNGEHWMLRSRFKPVLPWHWTHIVVHAMGNGRTLRHLAAESGEQT